MRRPPLHVTRTSRPATFLAGVTRIGTRSPRTITGIVAGLVISNSRSSSIRRAAGSDITRSMFFMGSILPPSASIPVACPHDPRWQHVAKLREFAGTKCLDAPHDAG